MNMKSFQVEILFDARFETLDLPLLIGCRSLLFGAYAFCVSWANSGRGRCLEGITAGGGLDSKFGFVAGRCRSFADGFADSGVRLCFDFGNKSQNCSCRFKCAFNLCDTL